MLTVRELSETNKCKISLYIYILFVSGVRCILIIGELHFVLREVIMFVSVLIGIVGFVQCVHDHGIYMITILWV